MMTRSKWISLPVMIASAAVAKDIYISPDGAAGAPGSRDEPMASLEQAAENARPGDKIHLLEGRYAEPMEVTGIPAAWSRWPQPGIAPS